MISVRALVREKNPRFAARIHPAVYQLLERIAHTRKLNRYLDEADGLPATDALQRALDMLGLSYRSVTPAGDAWQPDIDGPTEGSRITMVANHPHGGADALILLDLLCRFYRSAQVPANDLVRVVAPLAPFFVPVNKHGSNRDHFRRMDSVFSASDPVLLFPAGRTGRPRNGKLFSRTIVDFPWTRTFVRKSRAHGRTIIPVFIHGRNSVLFYAVAWMRSRLRIRTNLEMLLLADELLRQRGRRFRVVVGRPIDTARLDKARSDEQWARAIRDYVHAMPCGGSDDFFSWIAGYDWSQPANPSVAHPSA